MQANFTDPLAQNQAEQLFSLKEWMVAISGKLDRLENKLDTKADVAVVHEMMNRVSELERGAIKAKADSDYLVPQHIRMLEDVGVLKTKAAAISSVDSYRRWVWGTAFLSTASVVTAIVAIVFH